MPGYNVNASQAVILRLGGAAGTAHHQTDTGLHLVAPKMWVRNYQGAALTNAMSGGMLESFEVQNRSGSTAACGVGFRIANRFWIGGRLSANGDTYTDLTSSFQAQTAATLQVAGANQTGFVIGCQVPFDWASINITTAESNAGGSTVADHKVYYSNTAGSDWVEITAGAYTDDLTLSNTVYTAAVKDFVWPHSNAWGKWTSTILPTGYYYLRFTSAHREASDDAAVATGIEIGVMAAIESVEDNDVYANDLIHYACPEADGLVAYFQTANAGNSVKAWVHP
jgi:hypothetical protein